MIGLETITIRVDTYGNVEAVDRSGMIKSWIPHGGTFETTWEEVTIVVMRRSKYMPVRIDEEITRRVEKCPQ